MKFSKILLAILITIVLVASGVGVWYLMSGKRFNQGKPVFTPTISPEASLATPIWKTYQSQRLNLTLKYPALYGDVNEKEYQGDRGSGLEVRFSNNEKFWGCTVSADFTASRGAADCEVESWGESYRKCQTNEEGYSCKLINESIYLLETSSWEEPALNAFFPLKNGRYFTFENLDLTDQGRDDFEKFLNSVSLN